MNPLNHRIGRTLGRSSIVHPSYHLWQIVVQSFLKTTCDEAPTTLGSNLLNSLTVFSVRKFQLISRLDVPLISFHSLLVSKLFYYDLSQHESTKLTTGKEPMAFQILLIYSFQTSWRAMGSHNSSHSELDISAIHLCPQCSFCHSCLQSNRPCLGFSSWELQKHFRWILYTGTDFWLYRPFCWNYFAILWYIFTTFNFSQFLTWTL